MVRAGLTKTWWKWVNIYSHKKSQTVKTHFCFSEDTLAAAGLRQHQKVHKGQRVNITPTWFNDQFCHRKNKDPAMFMQNSWKYEEMINFWATRFRKSMSCQGWKQIWAIHLLARYGNFYGFCLRRRGGEFKDTQTLVNDLEYEKENMLVFWQLQQKENRMSYIFIGTTNLQTENSLKGRSRCQGYEVHCGGFCVW